VLGVWLWTEEHGYRWILLAFTALSLIGRYTRTSKSWHTTTLPVLPFSTPSTQPIPSPPPPSLLLTNNVRRLQTHLPSIRRSALVFPSSSLAPHPHLPPVETTQLTPPPSMQENPLAPLKPAKSAPAQTPPRRRRPRLHRLQRPGQARLLGQGAREVAR